jgi:hypothetical protein
MFSRSELWSRFFFDKAKQSELNEIFKNIVKLNSSNPDENENCATFSVLNDTRLEMEMRNQKNAIQLN